MPFERMKWSGENMPEQRGKIAIVTGANTGLGFETALGLAKRHCKVVLACRSLTKAAQAKQAIIAQVPTADCVIEQLDLADLASIRAFAQTMCAYPFISILVNNAGVMNLPFATTQDGFEMQMGTNHLGHFALTGLLLPVLLKAKAARIITVSSFLHRYGKFDFTDFQLKQHYDARQAYFNTKLANVVFSFELARRLKVAGKNTLSIAAHPGYANTGLQFVAFQDEPHYLKNVLYRIGNRWLAQSAKQGALPILYASTAPDVQNGQFYGPDGWLQLAGFPRLITAAAVAYDGELAKQLWDISEALTQVKFCIA